MTRCLALLVTLITLGVATPATAQHRLVLRDTSLVNGNIRQLNADGVSITEGEKTRIVGWDEIETGTAPDQKKFDTLLKDIGDPLFRIRQRLRAGDDRELADPAEKLFPVFADRSSGVAEAVCLATHLSRVARHQTEAALDPLLAALAVRARAGYAPEPRFATPAIKKLVANPVGLVVEFPPVFFDPAAAAAILPAVRDRVTRWPAGKAPLGPQVYLASLAACAGNTQILQAAELALKNQPGAADWELVLAAQKEITGGKPAAAVAALNQKIDALAEPARMVALYWSGTAALKEAPTSKAGVIALLTLPARYGSISPELAAAGLYRAAIALDAGKDARAAVAIRTELLTRFRSTSFGARLAQESTKPNPGGLQ